MTHKDQDEYMRAVHKVNCALKRRDTNEALKWFRICEDIIILDKEQDRDLQMAAALRLRT